MSLEITFNIVLVNLEEKGIYNLWQTKYKFYNISDDIFSPKKDETVIIEQEWCTVRKYIRLNETGWIAKYKILLF